MPKGEKRSSCAAPKTTADRSKPPRISINTGISAGNASAITLPPQVRFCEAACRLPLASLLCLCARCRYSDTKSSQESRRMITIEDFAKLDLRVATIKAAEPHPKADRLLVLQIDLGTEERQLVAGIRAHYTPEELIGKQIVVVANLQPAVLRGVESQGMLLAATDGERVVVLSPDKPVAAGSQVR
ncbi:MAG: methionine--tRNA ligase subunit beta [Candidatus Binatia bacterium]|nr:methionine--tRNA ligase subunit beta [Candidatus Binatia bacterium]